MKSCYAKSLVVLMVLLLALVVIDTSLKLNTDDGPCLAIPTRFILEEPECAEKLVRAANVTNVKILSQATVESRPEKEAGSSSENLPE